MIVDQRRDEALEARRGRISAERSFSWAKSYFWLHWLLLCRAWVTFGLIAWVVGIDAAVDTCRIARHDGETRDVL